MIADMIAFGIAHPFFSGLFVGGCGFGGALGVMGWCFGYEAAMRKARSWMRPKLAEPCDVPTLPPVRERRFIPTAGRS